MAGSRWRTLTETAANFFALLLLGFFLGVRHATDADPHRSHRYNRQSATHHIGLFLVYDIGFADGGLFTDNPNGLPH
jgi:hypothetical protein